MIFVFFRNHLIWPPLGRRPRNPKFSEQIKSFFFGSSAMGVILFFVGDFFTLEGAYICHAFNMDIRLDQNLWGHYQRHSLFRQNMLDSETVQCYRRPNIIHKQWLGFTNAWARLPWWCCLSSDLGYEHATCSSMLANWFGVHCRVAEPYEGLC